MKIRQIKKDLLAFFPILEIIFSLGLTIDYYVHGITYILVNNHPPMLFSPIVWIIILLVGGLIGLAGRYNFYIYYFSVSFPLQLFAVETHHIAEQYLASDLLLVLIIVILSLASSIYLGKILPRKRIWIF